MKKLFIASLVTIFISTPLWAQAQQTYPGEFSSIQYSNSKCTLFYEKTAYAPTLHELSSPRGALLHFPKSKDGVIGFFDSMNLIGPRGYDEVVLEKTVNLDANTKARIRADGFYDYGVLYLNFKIQQLRNSDSQSILECEATADFAGFSKSH